MRIVRFLVCYGVSRTREVEAGFGAADRSRDGGGELEAIEKDHGAPGVDLGSMRLRGKGGDQERDGDLNGLGVFDGRVAELNWILRAKRILLRGIGLGGFGA
jgi:hypothetical protein